MRKYLSLLLALCLCALSLFGCAPASENSITVYNWEDYINPEVIDLFEEEIGIQVNYVRFTTNEEMYIKLEKGGASYDVAFPSDYMIERMVQNDMLLPLDHEKLPNFTNNAQWLQDPDYDPTASIPCPTCGERSASCTTPPSPGAKQTPGAPCGTKSIRKTCS